MRKGQASFEYLGVSLVVITLLIVVMGVAFNLYREQREEGSVADARNGANSLADAVNFLCASPINTTIGAFVTVPRTVNLTASSIQNRTIAFFVQTAARSQNVTANTDCFVSGQLPSAPGRYRFIGRRCSNYTQVNASVTAPACAAGTQ